MALIEWDEDRYATGIERFDEQHQRLFDLLNQLHRAMEEGQAEEEIGDALRELEEYTEYHFGDEENFMEDCGYAHDCEECFFGHKEMHDTFAEKVHEFRTAHENGEYVTMEVLQFARDWLDQHIAGGQQDQSYSDYYHDELDGEYDY